MKSPTRDEIFKIYCEDATAGDWHRPQENYAAGYRKGLKDAQLVKQDQEVLHKLLESILDASERVAMPVAWLSIVNDAGMKFIKSLPPAPEGEKP